MDEPRRYRVEHHGPHGTVWVLGAYRTFRAASNAVVIQCYRLAADGARGDVVLVDLAYGPQHELLRRPVSAPEKK